MYVSVPRKSRKDPVSVEELRNITTLAGLGVLGKVGWALVNEQRGEQTFTTIRSEGQCIVLE